MIMIKGGSRPGTGTRKGKALQKLCQGFNSVCGINCMHAETVGCISADFGCIYAETVGCIYADVGCLSMERLGA